MQGNGLNLSWGKFRLDIRKKFFTERMVRPWNRFPRAVVMVMAPALPVFLKSLDNALR